MASDQLECVEPQQFERELPRGWRWSTLGDLRAPGRSLVSGPFGSNIGSRFFVEAGVPVIRGNNLSLGCDRFNDDGFVFLTEEKAAEFPNCIAEPNDLVLTAAGTIGQVGIIPENPRFPRYVISNKQLRARLDTSKAVPLFVYYWLASPVMSSYIQSRNSGSTIPLINLSVLRSLPVPIPPLDVQHRTVDVLDSLDSRIALLHRTNETLEHIARTIFKSWFVDFDPVRAKAEGREPEGMDAATAALFPDDLQNSEFGTIPRGWSVETLGLIADVGIGKTPPRNQSQWFSEAGEGVVWVSIKDMGQAGTYVSESAEDLTPEAIDRFNIRVAPDNTVLVSFKLTVGRVCISDGSVATNEAIAHCPLKTDKISTEYLYCALKSFDYSQLGSTSSIATAVNSKSIRTIPVLIPPGKIAAVFAEHCGPLLAKIRLQQKQAKLLSQLRNALLPRLISGKLRLPQAEKLVEAVL